MSRATVILYRAGDVFNIESNHASRSDQGFCAVFGVFPTVAASVWNKLGPSLASNLPVRLLWSLRLLKVYST